MRCVTRVLVLAFAAVLLTSTAALAAPDEPEDRYQSAWYQEMAQGRFEEALDAYDQLAADAKLPVQLRAKAAFRAGVCLQKLRRTHDAKKAFQRVVTDFAAAKGVALQAARRLKGEDEAAAAFRKKVESLLVRFAIPPMLARWDRALSDARMEWMKTHDAEFPVPPSPEPSSWEPRWKRRQRTKADAEARAKAVAEE